MAELSQLGSIPSSPSAGMQDIAAHVQTGSEPFSQNAATNNSPIQEPSLSLRQRLLPRLDLRILASALAVMVFMVGLGSATFLVQRSQDVRQQAYEDTLPKVAEPAVTTSQAPSPTIYSVIEMVVNTAKAQPSLIFVLLGGSLVVGAFVYWLYNRE